MEDIGLKYSELDLRHLGTRPTFIITRAKARSDDAQRDISVVCKIISLILLAVVARIITKM